MENKNKNCPKMLQLNPIMENQQIKAVIAKNLNVLSYIVNVLPIKVIVQTYAIVKNAVIKVIMKMKDKKLSRMHSLVIPMHSLASLNNNIEMLKCNKI